jgi:CDP-diacylglycerol---glycerol-3-phosphate 3-phosphatidyltransferase
VNLPNSITVARIVAAPLVGWLPFVDSWGMRLAGFVLFLAVAISDYWDGKLARSRNLITDLGKQLDPLADKLFLVATFVPMYLLMQDAGGAMRSADGLARPVDGFPFVTPWGLVPLPLWVVLLVLGREAVMTVFRSVMARRGVVIASIGPAKWKTGFQMTWVGAAYFWFFAATAAAQYGWDTAEWRAFAWFNGLVGVVTMVAAVALTIYSLWLYLRTYAGATRA